MDRRRGTVIAGHVAKLEEPSLGMTTVAAAAILSRRIQPYVWCIVEERRVDDC